MGLTRIRAEQISDIDYKQAVRVITLNNVTLSGGAPSTVDGVNLSAGDRVLVNGQNTGSQNGLYIVQTVGAGSNGTWIRSDDANVTGEIEAGMIVMVTEGNGYKDTQWKLTTNNPIIVGATALVFEQNSAFAFGNIYANGTAVLANSVGDTVTFTAGNNIAITGNNTSKSVTIEVTGISLNSISNGTSNVNVISSGGNVTVGIGGTDNIAVFHTGGLAITGSITGNGANLSGINAFSNIAVAGGNACLADSISDTLTLSAGTGITLVADAATDTITIATSGSGESIFATGGDMTLITNVVLVSEDLGLITAAVLENYDLGAIVTSGVLYPDLLYIADIADFFILGGTNGQYLGTSGGGVMQWQHLDSAPLSGNLAGNIQGNSYSILNLASLTATGVVSATGNISGANFTASGNISGASLTLTGGVAANGYIDLNNGTSNVHLPAANGNVHFTVAGNSIIRVTATGIVNDMGNGVGNIGNSTGYFNTIFAKATSAQYADLAEKYLADQQYSPGTVLVFGGDKEVTISNRHGDTRVAGVVSTNPSYVMNATLEGNHTATIALTGRVPTLVQGPVNKGDLMISAPNGYAVACNKPEIGTVIGKSLENLSDQSGIIEIVVGVR